MQEGTGTRAGRAEGASGRYCDLEGECGMTMGVRDQVGADWPISLLVCRVAGRALPRHLVGSRGRVPLMVLGDRICNAVLQFLMFNQ
jgi:hypothetical protein